VHEEVTCRMDLMRKMGELIPKLTVRKKRIEQELSRQADYRERVEAYHEKKALKNGKKKGKGNRKK